MPPVLYLASIDCDTGVLNHREAYQWHGIDMEELQLWSGNTLGEWIVTWQASQPANILLYRVRWDMQLASTAPVVIDEMTEDMTRMGPVVFVAATEPDITAILLQPAFDDTGPTLVRVSHIARENMGQPKHVGFAKPIFDVVKQRGQEKSVKTQIIETALKAGVHVHARSWYLLMFDVENDMSEDFVVEFPNFTSTVKGRPYWCFWVTGGPLPVSKPTWKYQFHIKIPADSAPYGSFRDDVMVGAFIINGPIWVQSLQGIQQTVIVAIGLIKKEAIGLPDEQARPLRGGELVCLSEHEQVVQECKEEIVEQVELCLVH